MLRSRQNSFESAELVEEEVKDNIEPMTPTKQFLAEPEPQVIEGFGDFEQAIYNNSFDGIVFLMSKNLRLKDHYAVVNGKEAFFYRRKDDKKHKLMHSLIGTYIKTLEPEKHKLEDGKEELFYSLKIIFPPNRSRVLYFKREANMQYWRKHLKTISEQKNITEYYKIERVIGEGEFGQVNLAVHK